MDTPSVVKEFLDERTVKSTRSVEVIYRYHADMERGSRLSGCEIVMRAAEDAVFVRAELPVSVMIGETRGVAKYLADLNKKRLDEDEQGYFDLDYAAGKIVFAIRVIQPITTGLLDEVVRFCLGQIDKESEAILKVVCEECEAVRQEEEERRQQREKELRGPFSVNMIVRGVKRFFSELPRPSFMKKRRGVMDDLYDDELEDYERGYYAGRPEAVSDAAHSARRTDASKRGGIFERFFGTGLVAEDDLEELTDDMLCPEGPGEKDMPSGEEEEPFWPEEEVGEESFLTDGGIDEEIPADEDEPDETGGPAEEDAKIPAEEEKDMISAPAPEGEVDEEAAEEETIPPAPPENAEAEKAASANAG